MLMSLLIGCAKTGSDSPCPAPVMSAWSHEDSRLLADEIDKAGEYPLMRRAVGEYYVIRRQVGACHGGK